MSHSGYPSYTPTLDFDDIESKAKKRGASVVKKNMGYQQYLSVNIDILFAKAKENTAIRTFDYIWVCSELDKQELEKTELRKAKIIKVPNTIYVPLKLEKSSGCSQILFLGAMSYHPNIDAALFFSKEILPRIREHMQQSISFSIVGGSPTSEVKKIGEMDGVIVTGRVESVDQYYCEADIVVVPIRFGGGTRIKILEAMAFGRLVVSTSVGCEGLDMENNKHLIIADSSAEFVSACVKYLTEPELRYDIERSARKFVEENYSYQHAVSIFNEYY